jgi:hypothetical protein
MKHARSWIAAVSGTGGAHGDCKELATALANPARRFHIRCTHSARLDPMFRSLQLITFSAALVAALGCATERDTGATSDTAAGAMEGTREVAGGGIAAAGWSGRIDAGEARDGQRLENAKLEQKGDTLVVTTGPAVVYWNPANTAAGNYTVRATFTEPQYMNVNDHPHPYGLFIGGNDMGTDQQSYLYCSAYGDGRFIVRGFGPEPFQMNGRRGEENAAVNKAAGPNQPVTQQISMSVKADKVECAINGTTVGSYDKSAVVGAGKLKSTDGVYGIRFAHNTDGRVTGLRKTTP